MQAFTERIYNDMKLDTRSNIIVNKNKDGLEMNKRPSNYNRDR